ncbi:MAG: DUF3307 domain-containing protein [Chitinophagaceae bacterium]|nr:DUF3307 domain-containing protein [Chitinophagaceae bacterium]
MILFLKLLLAHLLGDFVLQPESWVKEKELKKYRSPKLYLHVLIHFILMVIFTRDISLLPVILIISVSHLLIDILKVGFQNEHNRRTLFFVDQVLHLLVLVITVIIILPQSIIIGQKEINYILILFTAILFLLSPSSIIIKTILSKWTPDARINNQEMETSSLLNAGKMIGYLERLLVFIFILNVQWAAIGFLVTAKSVFRFGDLKMGRDRKLTEYILIGTLLSFGMAILVGTTVEKMIAIIE